MYPLTPAELQIKAFTLSLFVLAYDKMCPSGSPALNWFLTFGCLQVPQIQLFMVNMQKTEALK